MNVKENVINILEGDARTSSNCSEGMNVDGTVNISDLFTKGYDFSIEVPNNHIDVVLSAEAEKENECVVKATDFAMDNRDISKNVTTVTNNPIWVMIDKKVPINKSVNRVDTQILPLTKLGTTDSVFYLSNKYDSKTNRELIKLKLPKDTPVHNNISNTRNLPNILKGPKTVFKSNMFSSIPFETEDSANNISNDIIKNNICKEKNNKNTKKSHRKRKQIHCPLIIQEESMNLVANTKSRSDDESMKKNKFDSKEPEKSNKSYQEKVNHKKKPLVFKKVRNKISLPAPMKESVQNLDIATNVTTDIHEETKEKISDFNISSEFNIFYEEQFHEDYMDHIDILTDTLKEYQVLSNSYDINSNKIPNSNDMEHSELQCEGSKDYDFIEEKECTRDYTSLVNHDHLSDYEDFFHSNDNSCLISAEHLESMHVSSSDCNLEKASIHNLCNKNCLSSFFSDLSNDGFCLENLTYNCLQNSFNKDEIKQLDTLLDEEKKCETNLESYSNNDLNSSNIDFTLVNDLSANVSLECIELNNTNVSEENQLNVEETIQKEMEAQYNYTIEFNYEQEDENHLAAEESDASTTMNESLSNIRKEKTVIEPLQCLLCALTFTSKRTLALHLAGAHGDMYLILCERCGRLFNKKCIFNRHFIHCGCVKLPFSCKQCNKTYRHKSSLLHHLKIVHQIENKRDTTKDYDT
ncbi:hypothetical protein KPH14_008903 [Odynerus spinipes]|uniref:C2H2-type domain-containing protein n=1 Tax=Odynerus spinipes TaxID=1348599 RepID=A0AAD9RP81_9HYME|nr:hypothetical protein KPH14_008903 [Odynerus spinipes]